MTNALPHSHLKLHDLSALVAGIPYIIGFPPTNSLVLFAFRRSPLLQLAATMRVDLPEQEHVRDVTDHLLSAAQLNEAIAAIAVVVGGEIEQHRPLVEELRLSLEDNDIPLVHASWVREVKHGEHWRCYDDPQCTDVVPDPQSSTVAAALAVAGERFYVDRDDMAADFTPDPDEALARRRALLEDLLVTMPRPYTEEEAEEDMALITETVTWIEETSALPALTDRDVTRMARALSHSEIRDQCLTAALNDNPESAERLWTLLVRALPSPERAEPASLLAMSAYLRGSGLLASLATNVALDANPGHTTALLLQQTLALGVPPHRIRTRMIASITKSPAFLDDDDPPWDTTEPNDGPTKLPGEGRVIALPGRPTDMPSRIPSPANRPSDRSSDVPGTAPRSTLDYRPLPRTRERIMHDPIAGFLPPADALQRKEAVETPAF